jgi:catechol 2,3-dioxygenase-like lactoylglutathione lyase family enzyme
VTISKISNVILTVSSLERALTFYRDVLGMRVNSTIPGEFSFLDAGGIILALREARVKPNPGLTEIVFEVKDVMETYEELKVKGVAFPYPPRAVTGNETSDLYATNFQDPDGHTLSITSWIPKK